MRVESGGMPLRYAHGVDARTRPSVRHGPVEERIRCAGFGDAPLAAECPER